METLKVEGQDHDRGNRYVVDKNDERMNRFQSSYPIVEGVIMVHELSPDFEVAYLSNRGKEGRIYSDQEVVMLPNLPNDHPHHREWKLRKRSVLRLKDYLLQKGPQTILDLGCGNGWLTPHLRVVSNTRVYGIDVNLQELRQGARIYGSDVIQFVYGDIFTIPWPPAQFDQIILMASVQYFQDLPALIRRLLELAKVKGEVHIIDSPIYDAKDVAKAKQRSEDYYNKCNSQEMKSYYHHHCWQDLFEFNYKIAYDPSSYWKKCMRKLVPDSPFPWIKIGRHQNDHIS